MRPAPVTLASSRASAPAGAFVRFGATWLMLLAACGGGNSGPDADPSAPDAGVDAVPGVGCTSTSPRTQAPEVLIGPTGLRDRFVALINGADQTLDLQMYLFTVDQVADAVVAAHQRGVDVRVLLDPDHEGNPDVRSQLQGAGITVRDAPAGYQFAHAKYMIVDGAAAMIGSANFNVGAFNAERNYVVIDRDPDDIADLQAIFDADWTGAAQPDLSCTRLVASPINARSRVLQLIASAQATLDLELIYLSDSNVRTSVADAHRRGVAVRVLLEGDYPDNATTVEYMQNQGIPVKLSSALSIHAKLIIADGKALVGSHNMSATSLTDNREVGVVVFETSAAQALITQFGTDWNAAVTP